MIQDLVDRGPVLMDGAMGTMLMDEGLPAGSAPERWNLDRPDCVLAVHRRYAEAGASVLQTNTFGASLLRLSAVDDPHEMTRINTEAARLAREACAGSCAVAGTIGPSGKFLAPVGDADPDQLLDGFARQAEALATGGVDFLLVETMVDLREAVAALAGARKGSGLPVAVTVTFSKTPRGFFTIMGDTVQSVVETLEDKGAAAVGSNCTLVAEEMNELVSQFVQVASLPLLFQPNAGQPVLKEGRLFYPSKPEDFANHLCRMIEQGAGMVGGCCGTTPEHIRRTRARLASLRPGSHAAEGEQDTSAKTESP